MAASWTFDPQTRSDIDLAVSTATTTQQKIAAIQSAIIAAFPGASTIQFSRNGVSLPAIDLTGQPTAVGDTVQWGPAPDAVVSPNEYDIDTGTWAAKIVGSTGRIAYAASVGKAAGVFVVTDDIRQGSQILSVGPIVFRITSVGLGASSPPPGPPPPANPNSPTAPVATFISRMQDQAAAPNHAGGGSVANPYSAIRMPFNKLFWDLVYPPANAEHNNYFDSFAAWFWAYLRQGSITGKRLQVRRFRAGVLQDSFTGSWWDSGVVPFRKAGYYGQTWNGPSATGSTGLDARVRNEDSDGVSLVLDGSVGIELWCSTFYVLQDRAIAARARNNAWVCECRVINEDGTPYTGADAKYVVNCGYDPYNSQRNTPYAAQFTGGIFPNAADGGAGGWIVVDGSMGWTTICGAGITGTNKSFQDGPPPPFGDYSGNPNTWLGDDSPYVMTPAEFTANPPLFLVGGGGSSGSGSCGITIGSVNQSGSQLSWTVTSPGCTTFQSWLIDATTTPNTAGDGYVAQQVFVQSTGTPYIINTSSIPAGNYRLWARCNDSGSCQDSITTVPVTIAASAPSPTPAPGPAPTPSGSFIPSSPPGSGWTTLLSANDTPVALPWHHYGWHRFGGSFPAAAYPYANDRNWDYWIGGGADCCWARCEPSEGQFNWAGPDDWYARTDGKFRIFTISLTPQWAVAPSDRIYSSNDGVRYGSFPNGSFPPQNMQKLANFVSAIIARYPGINAIENWNEPLTPDAGFDSRNYGASGFYNGSIRELVKMAKTIKETIAASSRPGIMVYGCAWEGHGGPADSALSGISGNRFKSFLHCTANSDGSGGRGADYIDVHTHHPYMYNYDPIRVWDEIRAYRRRLQEAASELGMPALASKPLQQDETGHENPQGQQGGYGSGTYESFDTIAKDLKQAVGMSALGHVAHGPVHGITLYQDRSDQQTFKAPINNNATLLAAATYAAKLNGTAASGGRVIRQAAIKTNGSVPAVWIRMENGGSGEDYLA